MRAMCQVLSFTVDSRTTVKRWISVPTCGKGCICSLQGSTSFTIVGTRVAVHALVTLFSGCGRRKVDCIWSMSLIVSFDRYIGFSLLRTKDLRSFMVRVPSIKIICPKHAKESRLNDLWITNTLYSTLSRSQFQFLSSRAHTSDTILQILIIRNDL